MKNKLKFEFNSFKKQTLFAAGIITLLILGVLLFLYYRLENYSADKITCQGLKNITSDLSIQRPELQIMDNTENKEQLDNLEVMFDRKKPLQAHTVEFVSVGNTNEKFIEKLLPTYIDNIEPKIISLGFEKEFDYSITNVNYYQYKKGDYRVIAAIPTSKLKNNDDIMEKTVKLQCGKINPDYVKLYEGISSFFEEELYSLEILEVYNNTLRVNVIFKDLAPSDTGVYTFDISKEKFERIYNDTNSKPWLNDVNIDTKKEFYEYVNRELGIKMSVPKFTIITKNEVKCNAEVKVFHKPGTNELYIYNENYDNNCQKQKVNTNNFRINNDEYDGIIKDGTDIGVGGFGLRVYNFKSKEELEKILKDNFGKYCKVKSIVTSGNKKTVEMDKSILESKEEYEKINPGGELPYWEFCAYTGKRGYPMFINAKENKVIFNVGFYEAVTFWNETKDYIYSYDNLMFDSVEFLE